MDVAIIATIVNAAAITTLASVSYSQLRALRQQMSFSTFLKLMDDMDGEQASHDREVIYTLSGKGEEFLSNMEPLPIDKDLIIQIATDPSKRETRNSLERTIKNLDKVGYVLLRGHGKKHQAPRWIWDRSLAMWCRIKPFVEYVRTRPGRQNYAIYFEALAEEAAKNLKRNC